MVVKFSNAFDEQYFSLENVEGQTVLTKDVINFFSSHEEADTRSLMHCLHVAQSSSRDTNIIYFKTLS